MKGEWYAIIALGLLTLGLIPIAISVADRAARHSKENGGSLTRANLLEAFGLFLMAFGTLILTFWVMGSGRFWVLEAPMKLAVGWVGYLDRVERNVKPDAMHVVSAVVCLAATVLVAHLVLRWLTSTAGRSWPLKRTVQVLMLVGLMFASGLAVAGLVQQTSWLIRTPEPLVKDARSIS